MTNDSLIALCSQCGCHLNDAEKQYYGDWCERCERAALHNEKLAPSEISSLLPCPFCGRPAQMRDAGDGDSFIGCNNGNCKVFPTSQAFSNSDEAKAAWNTRAIVPVSVSLDKACYAYRKSYAENEDGEQPYFDELTDKAKDRLRRDIKAALSAVGLAHD